MATLFTWAEIAKHTTKEDLWIVVDNKVYDVTAFGDDHPGGVEVILETAGKDATTAFESIGHSDEAKKLLTQYYIGDVLGAQQNTEAAPHVVPPPVLPTKKQSLLDNTLVKLVGVAIPIVVVAFVIKKYWK